MKKILTVLMILLYCWYSYVIVFNKNDSLENFSEIYSIDYSDNEIIETNITKSTRVKNVVKSDTDKGVIYELSGIQFSESNAIVTTEYRKFEISKYTFYEKKLSNGNTFYAADVVTNNANPEKDRITGIFIFPKNSGKYIGDDKELFEIDFENNNIIELVTVSSDFKVLYKFFAPIKNEDDINKLNIIKHDNHELNPEVLKSIESSISYESIFKSKIQKNNITNNLTDNYIYEKLSLNVQNLQNVNLFGGYANSSRTVSMNQFDHYTNQDGILKEYLNVYKNKNHIYYSQGNQVQSTDDPIVNLIPKELFMNRGTYSYIGMEYGFYINTYQDFENDNISEFILFDITRSELIPERTNDESPYVLINPAFKGSFIYKKSLNIVYEQYPIETYLALGNISIQVGLRNINQLNIDDTGYDKYNDYGNFFSSMSVTAQGTGIRRDSTIVDLSLLKVAVAGSKFIFSGTSGTLISLTGRPLISAIESHFNGYYQTNAIKYYNIQQLSNGKYFANNNLLGNNNANSVISNYGNLPKSLTAKLVSNIQNSTPNYPLLYKEAQDFFKVNYSFSQKNSSINWDTLVATQIELDIYRDDTGWFLWWTTGNLTLQDSVYGGKVEHFNESPSNSNGGVIKEGSVVRAIFRKGEGYASDHNFNPIEGSYQDFLFTPLKTYIYTIETFNSNGDPYIKVFDNIGNLIAFNDDGAGDRNSKVRLTLSNGVTYKIRVSMLAYKSGILNFIIKQQGVIYEPNSNNLNAIISGINDDLVWYEFLPRVSDNYTYYSTGDVNIQISLFDHRFNLLNTSSQHNTTNVLYNDFYLTSGRKYYLRVKRNTTTSITTKILVNRQELIKKESAIYHSEIRYDVRENIPEFFRFVPNISKFYTIETFKTMGNPTITIYDDKMNQIAYNDDGTTSLNARITINLISGKTYFIMIRSANNTGDGYGHVMFI